MKELVETSVYRSICATIDMAMEMRENAIIIGAPGVGKTIALKAYTSDCVNIARLTITKSTARRMKDILANLCEEMDIPAWRCESVREFDLYIKRFHIGEWVVIVDEAQALPNDTLRELLTFSPLDDGPLQFVFCGNDESLKQINAESGALAQISRRIKYRAIINSIYDDDSDALTKSFDVVDAKAYEKMRAVGRHFHADGVVSVLNLAQRFAGQKTIELSHILDALDILTQYRSALEAKPRRRKAG